MPDNVEQMAQRRRDLDAAYAAIVIPPLALEDLRRSAFYFGTTAMAGTIGIDVSHTLLREGARMFLVELEKRIDKARKPDLQPTAVTEPAVPVL